MTWYCQQTLENKRFVDITQQCFALLPQVNFPAINLNLYWRWRWWDQIQAIFLNLLYFCTKAVNQKMSREIAGESIKMWKGNNDKVFGPIVISEKCTKSSDHDKLLYSLSVTYSKKIRSLVKISQTCHPLIILLFHLEYQASISYSD